MKHRWSFGVVALVAGTSVLGVGQMVCSDCRGLRLRGAEYSAAWMSEAHARAGQGYIGIEMRDISEEQVGELKLKDANGVEITNLDHDGPACKAGMRMHDVILQMNGQAIEGGEQLRKMLREVPVGRSVSFLVSRDGQTQTMTMMTADRRTVGLQAWEQHYSVPAPGPSGVVRGNSFFDSGKSATATAQKEHKDLLGTETIVLSSSFTGAKLEVMGQQLGRVLWRDRWRRIAGAKRR